MPLDAINGFCSPDKDEDNLLSRSDHPIREIFYRPGNTRSYNYNGIYISIAMYTIYHIDIISVIDTQKSKNAHQCNIHEIFGWLKYTKFCLHIYIYIRHFYGEISVGANRRIYVHIFYKMSQHYQYTRMYPEILITTANISSL
jgi:hypothetical protein